MQTHNITPDEYITLDGDQRSYLPQPNPKFEDYRERVAHVLGLDYQGSAGQIQSRRTRGQIAGCDESTGRDNGWRDEDPNAVF